MRYMVTKKETTLTSKHQRFAELVVSLGNATEAYREAGYSSKGANGSAARLLANASIQAEILRLKERNTRKGINTRAFVLDNLHDLATNGTPDSVRVSASVALGKTERMFVDVSEAATTQAQQPALKSYTLDELVALRSVFEGQQQQPQAAIEDVVVEDD